MRRVPEIRTQMSDAGYGKRPGYAQALRCMRERNDV
jgi:hypothetical protein